MAFLKGILKSLFPVATAKIANTAPLPAPPYPLGPYPEHIPTDNTPVDWIFITHQDSKGWILDGICREIGSRHPGPWFVAYNPPQPGPAKNYFFSHYLLYLKHFLKNRKLFEHSNTFIWYTHPRDEKPEVIAQLCEAFNAATRVIFSCSAWRDLWISYGLKPERGVVVLGGAHEGFFPGHVRGSGCVGLSSSYYERKNPDLVRDLVRLLPHRQFMLLGKGWEAYGDFPAMLASSNFSYETASYAQYPRYYAKFDVFLSTSTLEGGPIPLLECMMCNAVPVSSITGFVPDLVRHGENGYLFETNAKAEDVAPLIEAAFAMKTDIRSTVLPYTWEKFAKEILSFAR